jgi:glutamate-5-semialdehyde dehydrogenase
VSSLAQLQPATGAPETAHETAHETLALQMRSLGVAAREASAGLALADSATKNKALFAAAAAIRARAADILQISQREVASARARNLSSALLDRLELNPARIEAMAIGLEEVAGLPDPVGDVMAEWERPNGLNIQRVRVPLGVIAIIYESRPNVTADAGGLCLKSGNAAILRGGSESFESSGLIAACLREGLAAAGLPQACIQQVPTTDRAAVGELLRMDEFVDVVVPRGGRSLIERVAAESRIPVFKHLDGICHVYVHESADGVMARDIIVNAKLRRTGVCGSAETLLVDRKVAARYLPGILAALIKRGCEIRGDGEVMALEPRAIAASEEDWSTEYLDAILSVKLVDGVEEAVAHINRYGSHHTDSIIAGDAAAVATFFNGVDSAILLHNASTQFADGGEFGMGAEIGISTGKLHARGPVGAEQLTSYKYLVRGSGQCRP